MFGGDDLALARKRERAEEEKKKKAMNTISHA
jgi:hypothetical protein